MTEDLKIRLAGPRDVEPLLDLYEFLSSDAERCPIDLARANLRKISNYTGSAVFLGEVGVACVATCTLIIVPNLTRGGTPYGLIENVVTHEDYRDNGYGKRILADAVDHAWENGCYKVMLSTGSSKPDVLSFYESAGFEQSRTGFQQRRLPPRAE